MAYHNEVKFLHLRAVDADTDEVTNPRGGITLAYRQNEDGSFDIGVAQCSRKDNYNKRIGRAFAEHRLLNEHPVWSRHFTEFTNRNELLEDACKFYAEHTGYLPKIRHRYVVVQEVLYDDGIPC